MFNYNQPIFRKNLPNNRGLIKAVVLILGGLIILAYLGVNLRSIMSSSTFRDNWMFIKDLSINIWNNYISDLVNYIWIKILVPYVLEPIRDNIIKSSS